MKGISFILVCIAYVSEQRIKAYTLGSISEGVSIVILSNKLKFKMHEIITSECVAKGIAAEHIELGCEHAEYWFEKTNSLSQSVLSGIAVAKGQQKRAEHQRRSSLIVWQ